MKKINIATIFSGIGAPEFALKRLGVDYNLVFASDNGDIELTKTDSEIKSLIASAKTFSEKKEIIDSSVNPRKKHFVKETYLKNYKIDEKNYHHDVRYLDATQYNGSVDILIGGSPCQSFSSAGFQKGLDDARGTLFYEYARVVKESKPKVFIYENVRGLINHDKGNTWEIVKGIFDSLGYKTHYKIINSKNHNIPQNRTRVFVIGFLDESVDFSFPKDKKLEYSMQDFLENYVDEGNMGYSETGELKIVKRKRKKTVDNERFYPSERVLKHVMSPGTKNYFSKIAIDLKVARPILATMHKMHRASVDNYVTDNKRIRMITPREAHRIMGFTDDFSISESYVQGWKQAGNSIVVDVLMDLFKEIFKAVSW